MCGIVGYTGSDEAAPLLLEALRRLEYRGYDSAGIAALAGDRLGLVRAVGKLDNLAARLADQPLDGACGIGHTRWATHGGVTEANAHPHSADGRVAVVHNGIIENYAALRAELEAGGAVFASQTDSEVLAHLFAAGFARGLAPLAVLQGVLGRIEGAWALAAVSLDAPGVIMIARNASPLAVGLAEGFCLIASDASAMAQSAGQVIYLKDDDYGLVTPDGPQIYDRNGQPANREALRISASPVMVDKAGYRHFMEKEIHEQPDAVAHTLAAMTGPDGQLSAGLDTAQLQAVSGLVLLAAGTSHYAALIGKYWIERLAGLPVAVELASEYHYRQPASGPFSHALVISQSGESLDTLMAMRHAAGMGLQTLGLVNVPDSTIAREAAAVLPTRAGPEIGVASTKAFTAQLTVMFALAVALGRASGRLDEKQAGRLHEAVLTMPGAIGQALGCVPQIQQIAKQLVLSHSVLFLGRDLLYPLALEGALKLKEISYLHAEGFAAGEMKHGPIALIEPGLPVIGLVSQDVLQAKTISNLREAEARGADLYLISCGAAPKEVDFARQIVEMPDCDPLLAPLLLAIPAQILAWQAALEKGTDVDQPRNLAKSVTVE